MEAIRKRTQRLEEAVPAGPIDERLVQAWMKIFSKMKVEDLETFVKMMREGEAQAKKLGIKVIFLEVYATNERARHMYGKVGYTEVGCLPKANTRDGEYIDSIMMAKEITPLPK